MWQYGHVKAPRSAGFLCLCEQVCLTEQVKVRWWWRGAALTADWARWKVRQRSDMPLHTTRKNLTSSRVCTVHACVGGRDGREKTPQKTMENKRVLCIHLLLTLLSWWKSWLIYWLTFSQSVPVHYWATKCLWQQHRHVGSLARTANPHWFTIEC